jgi:NAD(P)-dependent dehydrogenase (short-subunit alcohol dehydrogenase family)
MRTAIVTGANRGLGQACSETILETPAWRVVLAVRDVAATTEIVRLAGGDRTLPARLDLGSLDDVRAFARRAAMDGPIDALVCNAGIQHVAPGLVRTKDGLESTFQVNFLGHFLLANLLLPHMAKPARIVFVSSGTHDPKQKTGLPAPAYTSAQKLAFPDEETGDPMKIGLRRYTTSKLCTVYGVHELHRRLREAGVDWIDVNAMDPGMMPGTDLAREYPSWMRWSWDYLLPALRPFLRNTNSPDRSGRNLAALAIAPEFDGVSGRYFEGIKEIRSSELSYDDANARDLWGTSCRLAGLPANGLIDTLKSDAGSDARSS